MIDHDWQTLLTVDCNVAELSILIIKFSTFFVRMMLQLFSLLSLLLKKCTGVTYCSNEYECASSTLYDDEIYCQGFASCIDAQTIRTSSTFYSYGSYASYGAEHVESADDSLCYGDSSCRNIGYFHTKADTDCQAYRSCFGSIFERTNATNSYSDISFYGDESGAFTTLNLNQNTDIFAKARLSMYKSIINMYASSQVYAQGFGSLDGAKLYCESGQTCTIYCHGYGCYNVSLMSGNGTYNIDCTHNLISSILCGNGDDVSIATWNNLSSDKKEIVFQNVDTYSLCSNSSLVGINCGNYEECANTTLTYANEVICCSSHLGCRDGRLIVNLNVSISDDSDIIAIYCGGYQSCRYGDNNFIIQTMNVDNSSQSISIACDGYAACRGTLLGADNLLCRGQSSCGVTRVNSMKNVFATGMWAFSNGNASNIDKDVYCLGGFACQAATFSNIGGNIYALAYCSLYYANINYADKVYAIGSRSGYHCGISNVKSLFASGDQVLYYATVSGFRNLHVNGSNSLGESVLTTQLTLYDDSVDSNVTLKIDGTNSNTYSVSCSSGDECFITCQSNTSCTNMILTCYGICYLNCGEYGDTTGRGNDCPSTIIGTWYPFNSKLSPTDIQSQTPTSMPTAPTTPPTHQPSKLPSQITSAAPSTLPTHQPSKIQPTILPMNQPSKFPSQLPRAPSVLPSNQPTPSDHSTLLPNKK